MSEIADKINALLTSELLRNCPVLSGNMRAHIHEEKPGTICIEAPWYDINLWKETGVILYEQTRGVFEEQEKGKKRKIWKEVPVTEYRVPGPDDLFYKPIDYSKYKPPKYTTRVRPMYQFVADGYAQIVNYWGAFFQGRHKGWVNDTVKNVVATIAVQYNAEVIYEI